MIDACECAPVRIPVPNKGACDWGLKQADITATCTICAQYFDGRSQEPWKDEPCVFVPNKGRCFPKQWALKNNFEHDSCGEFQSYWYNVYETM